MTVLKPLSTRISNLKQIDLVKKQDNLLSTQPSWIRALDSKFKICSKKLTNFRICYNALKLLIQQSLVGLSLSVRNVIFLDFLLQFDYD
jgi:hypothetical protein